MNTRQCSAGPLPYYLYDVHEKLSGRKHKSLSLYAQNGRQNCLPNLFIRSRFGRGALKYICLCIYQRIDYVYFQRMILLFMLNILICFGSSFFIGEPQKVLYKCSDRRHLISYIVCISLHDAAAAAAANVDGKCVNM